MSSKLGKRKERGEDVPAGTHHGSTLFVSNLPYSATSVDLQTLFSDIAPVKSAFVVTEHGTGISKGVGYVSFAIKEDAETAFQTISKEGISLVGRQLGVQWAESKPKRKEGKDAVKTESKPKPKPKPIPRLPHDPLAIRTIVVSGIPSGIDSKVLWKKIRKYEGAEKVEWPIKNESGDEDSSTANVLFSTAGQASDAVSKLHAHVYKGSLLSVTLKKRLDTLAKPSAKAKKAPAPSYASRLIVRNIPFSATEQDLRAVFLPYGPIHSIHIPTDDKPADPKEEGEDTISNHVESSTAAAYAAAKKPRTKGFAFVWMLSKKDAERALQGCNGTIIRAGVAEAFASDKQKKKKLKRLEQKQAKIAAGIKVEEGKDEEEQDVEEDEDNEKKATERVIAVDWALSKDKWKEEKKKLDDDEKMGSPSGSDNDSEDSEDGGLGFHSGSEDGSDSEDEKVKPELPPPETGTTLFVRNVPFNATEEELRTLFRAFGPLRYARITVDLATGRSRGTGFACFWNLVDADRAVEQSELLRAETTGQATAPKKNPFSLPSILTPDPSSSLAQSLVLHGRTLDVVRAVTRDTASKLKDANEKLREKADKRNMYLLREGVIMPNTTAAENLTPAEVEKRTSSFNARRALLKSNPSLFISRTRLSVRQIPTFVTERMLKRLTGHAMKAFNAEVKEGTREPLTADELADQPTALPGEDVLMSNVKQEDVHEETEKKTKKKFTGRDTGVKQTKIVRQAERVDPITGKGKSKGYGFMEMHRHSDALRVLRWANNNPQVGELFGSWWKDELESILKAERAKEKDRDDARIKKLKEEIERAGNGESRGKKVKGTLIVEFSIENIQVVQRRNALQEKSKTISSAPTGSPNKRTRKSSDGDDSKKGSDGRPTKRPRLSADTEAKPKAEEKPFNPLGSIIGRKRKEKKAGKK
ncbi:unnamed protein product [Cyclocybe aegerita]|uniref:RRM domain-containing protein n=1 Tax=Cyclocybe aegerita TaxID=1973307 RepID=A0A8S0WE49_CYCAE|nr:unnamed protein product [Cyclocybe aegerita]